MTDQKTETIKQLNDQCRKQYMIPQFGSAVPCRFYVTQGIQALSPENQIIIGAMVREFDDFSEGNDPYQEHDFGAFDFEGQKIFWKIDYYDSALEHGSEEYRKNKPPTTTKPPHTRTLNQAIFIYESAAMTCPQTV